MLKAGSEEQPADEHRTEKSPVGRELDALVTKPLAAQDKPTGFVCPTCGFVARSAAGLASHRRRHA